jgi:hypothetical protein
VVVVTVNVVVVWLILAIVKSSTGDNAVSSLTNSIEVSCPTTRWDICKPTETSSGALKTSIEVIDVSVLAENGSLLITR